MFKVILQPNEKYRANIVINLCPLMFYIVYKALPTIAQKSIEGGRILQ
jgi:hypothetical protein